MCVRDCTHKSNVQCLYKFPPCTSDPLLEVGGEYQRSSPGGASILGQAGAMVPCGTWREIVGWREAAREEGGMRNVFAQEGRGFPAFGAVNTSLAISSSGWFIQRYRQVMRVYLT